jgi:hypothetical protein
MGDLSFDRYQFEKQNRDVLRDVSAAFRSGEGKSDEFSINRQAGLDFKDLEGMQIRTVKGRPHRDATWARDEKKVLRLLRRVFPHVWQADRPMRLRHGYHSAARWFEVIRLYFAAGWDAKSIGERLNSTQTAVENVVQRVRRARRGMSQHGVRRRK